jgi:hypothetical protein
MNLMGGSACGDRAYDVGMQDAHYLVSIGLPAAREIDDSVFGGVTVVGYAAQSPRAERG